LTEFLKIGMSFSHFCCTPDLSTGKLGVNFNHKTSLSLSASGVCIFHARMFKIAVP